MRRPLITVCLLLNVALTTAQNKSPQSYKEFYKDGMKKIEGDYSIYRKDKHYYLEIPDNALGKDVLVMGYVRKGNSSAIAKSAGIIRFSKGISNSLNVTRISFNEGASGDINGDMEPVIKRSGLLPVSYGYSIVATGKKGGYIIEISRQILEGGDWFAFPDLTFLSHPDPERSVVEDIKTTEKAVRFAVERSQTDFNKDFVSGRDMDNANTYEIELVFQQLPDEKMPRKLAEKASPFETFSFMDYGRTAYTARKTSFIHKWNINNKISVALDPNIPAFFRKYIEQGVLAWNVAFHGDVLKIVQDQQLSPGYILVNWGNTYNSPIVATVEHPETGEILAARINVTEAVTDQLMLRYLLQCGANDKRIIKDIRNPDIQGEILRWLMTQTVGEALGLRANLSGSAAYTTAQLRNPAWMKTHAFSASIMDDIEFNYVAQPEDHVPVSTLMPGIGEADIAAIEWGYGQGPAPTYLPEDSLNPLTQHYDLASDKIMASTLAIKNLQRVFLQLDTISKQLDGTEDLFKSNGSLYGAALISYEKYCMDVSALIGGVCRKPLSLGEEKIKADAAVQKQALAFLQQYVFSGPAAWMKINGTPGGRVISVEESFTHMQIAILKSLIDIRKLDQVADANEIFNFIDKEVFFSFSKEKVLTTEERTMQAKFVYELAQATYKANISTGLNDANVLLHYYMITTMKKLEDMANTHPDMLTRENFRLMKMKAEHEFFHKIKA
ncbi:zinc-dependent metalloprotease [[Flexibacter] sp. ATCC 35208]|uniref:DUF5117 and DUF5118 domain-containing protein n=1 Tax=[Flexibacter] sp. ATCC 35208 TaxID=1936242 RepID=UPI0009F9065E|nr:zinc-dependent metalloprotease [[Flexibacter] sp. ATCC 35208]